MNDIILNYFLENEEVSAENLALFCAFYKQECNIIHDNEHVTLMAQLLTISEIKKDLRKGAVNFLYRKKTNSRQRNAQGTLNFKEYNIPYPASRRKHPPGLIVYWDLRKRAWRSFYYNRLLAWYRVDVQK